MKKPSPVVVIGDLLVDVLAEVGGPLSRGTDTRASISVRAGGSSANMAVWLARLGVETYFVGKVGPDFFGRSLSEELGGEGVIPRLAEDPSAPTGKVVILVDETGERTMITDRSASQLLRPEDLPEDLFETGRHLHLTGYGFSHPDSRRTVIEAMNRASETNMTISVDPSSVAVLEDIGPEKFLRWTASAGIIFPNLEEGALLAGFTNPESIVARLREVYPNVVLKLGADGAMFSGKAEPSVRLPAVPARVVDTTGAGDAFCAAFLASWLSGDDPEMSLRQSLEQASLVVGEIGGR
ncbi:sugar kinase [soil metagenome]|nr:sugar kinase [Rubrobacter sp.]